MRDFTDDLRDLRRRVTEAHTYLRIDDARVRLDDLTAEASRPDLWDDPDKARLVNTEMARVKEDVDLVDALDSRVSDLETLFELGREEDDDSVEGEIASGRRRSSPSSISSSSVRCSPATTTNATRSAKCTPARAAPTRRTGPTCCCACTRWAQQEGFEVELDERSEGTEAGISSATFIVKGRYAYGMLHGERGVHRLIRISPFDSNARRQTAFASLDVVPSIEQEEAPEIDVNDLRIDTYRSSGAGGQHVNVTDSAVRITHLPTGVVVSCQNERSQLQNRAKAMQILAARLAARQREERRKAMEEMSGEKRDVAFGSQIRTYTLAPYQLVKDERTRYETGNVQAVLDGDLGPFIAAYLQWRRQHEGP